MTDSLFLIDKHIVPIKIGEITDDNSKLTLIIPNNSQVNEFNKHILDLVYKDKGYETPSERIVVDDVTGIIIDVLRWRRCTGYVVLQKSLYGKIKYRMLIYLFDKVKHSAVSFGTNIDIVVKQLLPHDNDKGIIKKAQENLKNMNYEDETYTRALLIQEFQKNIVFFGF